MVELSGLLSNPGLGSILRGLQGRLVSVPSSAAGLAAPAAQCRPPQGQVLREIKAVLRERRGGLSASDVRRLVEVRLGRELPRSTVKSALAQHSRPSASFTRLRRGIYALRDV